MLDDFFPLVLDTGTLDIYTNLLDVLSKALPKEFCRFCFSVFLRFVAFCFLWVGGVPLAAFCPPFSLVLGGWVGDVCYLLHSCILLSRIRLRKAGRPACKPAGPGPPLLLARSSSPVSCWVVGGTGRGKGRQGDGVFVTLSKETCYDYCHGYPGAR